MALYNIPVLHNGLLNPIFNPLDFTNSSPLINLTQSAGDARYLRLIAGGTVSGNTTFSQAITVPSITLSGGTNAQTSSQVGYYKPFNSIITGGSLQNGSASSPAFNTLSLPAGVWLVSYYNNITCTASITFTQITHCLTTSSTGGFNQVSSQSSSVSETLASGSKYCSGTYAVRPSTTTSYYVPILMTYSTSGTPTVGLGMSAI